MSTSNKIFHESALEKRQDKADVNAGIGDERLKPFADRPGEERGKLKSKYAPDL